jgi:hypothetical protein
MARASFLNIQTGRNSAWLKTDLNGIIFDEISMAGGSDDVEMLLQAVASVALQDMDPTPESCVILLGVVRLNVQSGVFLHPIVRFEGLQQLQTMVPRDLCLWPVFVSPPNSSNFCLGPVDPKPQGMSITNLEVTCEDVWKEVQIYVALSRGRTLQGLAVHSLGRDGLCRADARVVSFYAAYEQGDAHRTDDSPIAGIILAAMSK